MSYGDKLVPCRDCSYLRKTPDPVYGPNFVWYECRIMQPKPRAITKREFEQGRPPWCPTMEAFRTIYGVKEGGE